MTNLLAVIDLAGTTVQADAQITSALFRACEAEGVRVTREQMARVRGMSKRDAISALVARGRDHRRRASDVYERFSDDVIRMLRAEPPQSVPGVLGAFEQLRASRVQIVLNTGFERSLAERIVEIVGWPRAAYQALVCGDDVSRGRPSPFLIFAAMQITDTVSVHHVANVGDTTNDLLAGFNAGVRWNIGVSTGAHNPARLAAAPHTHILNSIADVPSVLCARAAADEEDT